MWAIIDLNLSRIKEEVKNRLRILEIENEKDISNRCGRFYWQ